MYDKTSSLPIFSKFDFFLDADRTILAAHYIQSNSRFLQRSHEPQQQLQAQNQHFKWDNYIKNL